MGEWGNNFGFSLDLVFKEFIFCLWGDVLHYEAEKRCFGDFIVKFWVSHRNDNFRKSNFKDLAMSVVFDIKSQMIFLLNDRTAVWLMISWIVFFLDGG